MRVRTGRRREGHRHVERKQPLPQIVRLARIGTEEVGRPRRTRRQLKRRMQAEFGGETLDRRQHGSGHDQGAVGGAETKGRLRSSPSDLR